MNMRRIGSDEMQSTLDMRDTSLECFDGNQLMIA
jgi:hypothetical protein